jgi:hypothetical protein
LLLSGGSSVPSLALNPVTSGHPLEQGVLQGFADGSLLISGLPKDETPAASSTGGGMRKAAASAATAHDIMVQVQAASAAAAPSSALAARMAKKRGGAVAGPIVAPPHSDSLNMAPPTAPSISSSASEDFMNASAFEALSVNDNAVAVKAGGGRAATGPRAASFGEDGGQAVSGPPPQQAPQISGDSGDFFSSTGDSSEFDFFGGGASVPAPVNEDASSDFDFFGGAASAPATTAAQPPPVQTTAPKANNNFEDADDFFSSSLSADSLVKPTSSTTDNGLGSLF